MWCKKLERETFPDATVVAASRAFVWVVIDRDYTPELAKKFNVSAYPSLMVLNEKQQKVHRFQAFMKPPDLIAQLGEGLKRYSLYKSGQEWDVPNPRPVRLSDQIALTTVHGPINKVPAGMAFLNGDLWVGYMGQLYRLDATTGAVKQTFETNPSMLDITTDGKLLYGVDSGWTAAKPIYVIDPATGKTVREIVTAANAKNKGYAAKGITWIAGKLYVLDGAYGRIHEIDPATGDITRSVDSKEHYVTGLSFDGTHFVVGSRTAMILLDRETGAIVR